jgi:hypothetical protein
MEILGVQRRLPKVFFEADPKYKDADTHKIKLINELQDDLIRLVADRPPIIADDVYNTVLSRAIQVPYTEVTTDNKMELKKEYMVLARKELKASDKKFLSMQTVAADSTALRRRTMAKLEVINSHKPRKSPGSFCPVGCSMMGGRSYKYRNMRKSSRNMRKSRRKSRK